jgi:hypothetical protein
MRKFISMIAAYLAVMGVALAQMAASSNLFYLDVDPGRYGGPAGQRIVVQLGDEPRRVALGAEDEICVQLQRATSDSSAISAHVSALKPEPHTAAIVRVAGPGISPGTYRSTPWGLLLRVTTESANEKDQLKSAAEAPVCTF